MLRSMESQELDTTEQLNRAELNVKKGSQVALVVKNLPANAGNVRDEDSILELEQSPAGGHGNPL